MAYTPPACRSLLKRGTMESSGHIRSTRPAGEAGAAIIESAIILLVFLIVLFGIMEAGRVMNVQVTVTDAAREGARYAVTPIWQTSTLPSSGQIQSVVNGFLQASGISGATVTVQPVSVFTGSVTTQYTRVRIDAPYQPVMGAMFFSSAITIKGEALMRNETSP